MKTSSKALKDDPLPERPNPTPVTSKRRAASPPSSPQEPTPKCPGLEDLLGDYSEQTGSFFS